MQQTQKYKLNLIETSDTFSPAPLNENMEKLETALETGLSAESAARQSADSTLRSRVSTLEGHRIAVGAYDGQTSENNVYQTINLGFTPSVVFIQTIAFGSPTFMTSACTDRGLTIQSGGFKVCNDEYKLNYATRRYMYCALS